MGCAGLKELLPWSQGSPRDWDARGAAQGQEDEECLPLPWGLSPPSSTPLFMAVPERQHMHVRAGHNSAFLGFLRVRLLSALKGSPETGGLNTGN